MPIQPTRIVAPDFASGVNNLLEQFRASERDRLRNEEIERLAKQREATRAALPGAVRGDAGSIDALLSADPRLGLQVHGQHRQQSNADRVFDRLLQRDQVGDARAERAEARADEGLGIRKQQVAETRAFRNAQQARQSRQEKRAIERDARDHKLAVRRLEMQERKASQASKKATGKVTVDQAKSSGFARRTLAAEKVISNPKMVEAATDLRQKAAGSIPVIGNALVTPQFQKFDQARRDFVNAILRRESGAVISDSEFENANIQYFPQFGDAPEVIAQKAANRRNAIAGLLESSGPLGEQFQAESTPRSEPITMQTSTGISFTVE